MKRLPLSGIVFIFLLLISSSSSLPSSIHIVEAASQCSAPVTFLNGSKISFFGLPSANFPALSQIGLGGKSFQWAYKPCDPDVNVLNAPQQCPGSFLSQTGCDVTFPTLVAGYPQPNRDQSVKMQYTSNSKGLSWTATVYLFCDLSVPSSTMVAPGTNYDAAQTGGSTGPIFLTFRFASKAFCTDEKRNGNNGDNTNDEGFQVTWGVVFLIAFFVPLILYLVIMVSLNCVSGGKSGCKEICPHYNFWSLLPGLFLDGVTFLWSKIRGTHWESGDTEYSGYSSGSSSSGREVGEYSTV